MKNEFSFCFQADRESGRFSAYHAKYIHSDSKKERTLTIKHSDNLSECLPNEIGWATFYNNATFEEILREAKPDGINESLILKMHEFDEYNDRTSCRREGNKIHIELSSVVRKIFSGEIKDFNEYLKKRKPKEVLALEIIRDFPTAVTEKKYASVFADVLETARWSLDEKASDRAKKLLMKHLIPQRPGGKVPVPENIKATKAIMIELARHLSSKCRKHINSKTALSKDYKIESGIYKDVQKWATEANEPRIANLPINSLNTLVFSPPRYVNALLEKHFKCTLRTLGA